MFNEPLNTDDQDLVKSNMVPPNLPTAPVPPLTSSNKTPSQLQDIFDQAEQAKGFTAPRATAMPEEPVIAGPLNPLTELPDDDQNSAASGFKKFYWLGLVVLVAALAVAGYFAYQKFFKAEIIPEPVPGPATDQPPVENPPVNQPVDQPEIFENQQTGDVEVDSDKDGLTDSEEQGLGTEILEPDSDGDGLFDREEVKVYKTNPLLPDTDSDGYLDGSEVKNGYDPNKPGSARLLDINQ